MSEQNSTPNTTTGAAGASTATGEARSGTDTSAQEGKTFSQDDVNRIVGERLAKEKAKVEAEIAQREQELTRRELLIGAKERLAEKDLSPELLEALSFDSPKTLDKCIALIEAEIKRKTVPPKLSGVVPYGGAVSPPEGKPLDASIRHAMGLR